jgi:DNA-binding NarL/FixJ family response regulator
VDLVGRFRTLSPARILVLTGYGTEDLAIRALQAKVDD